MLTQNGGAIVLFGCVGGLLPDILRFIRGRYYKRVPRYLGSFTFWLGIVLLVAVGGLAAWALDAQSLKEALAYGYAAPELLSRLSAKYVEVVDRDDAAFDLRSWWAI